MDDLISEFIAESREMLAALELGLVAWERNPTDGERLSEIFRFVHTVKGNCGFFDLPRLEALAHAAEDALGEVRAGRRTADSRLVDAVLAIIDRIGDMVETLAACGEITDGDDSALIAMLAVVDTADQPIAANEPGKSDSVVAKEARATEVQGSVRLPTSLVDRVMSGVSDMILVRNELERQLRQSGDDPALLANFSRLSALLSEMQQAMSRVRMQPIGNLLGSYQRLIRDLSAELGKQVLVEIESGQVELDREMIELLRDPLLHIIRNAIDHGLETPAERSAAGKRPEGRLLLSARQTGNEIRIAILDDGRGIDADKVVERAIERGILSRAQASQLDQSQKLMLICEPGLSTAEAVTAISGRGVGMDVVRASIERIGGRLRIVSAPGDGTRFLLDVPLTLSIVPSITVAVGGHVFAVPRSYVREIVRNGREVEVERIGGTRHVKVRGELYPCVGLNDVLQIPGEEDPDHQTLVMITMIDGSVFALCVDEIADHCDLVVRPLAPQVIATGLYVGVAQLNDGTPSLMLDMVGLSQQGGLSIEKNTRVLTPQTTAAEIETRELVDMIVFAGLDGTRRAVRMDNVVRLLEVPVAEVGKSAGHDHIVFEGAIVPLHGADGHIVAGSLDVLILSDRNAQIAYATAGSIDTAEIDMRTLSRETGRVLALIEDQSVELLELGEYVSGTGDGPTCRLPGDSLWASEVLRPLIESAGYAIVEDAAQAVDVEIAIDGGNSAAGEAAETILIGSGKKPARRRNQAPGQDDTAEVTAPVRAAAKRRVK